jgi:hypothetical protein
MNPKNRIENIIIIICTAVVTAVVYNYIIVKPMKQHFADELSRNTATFRAEQERSYNLIYKLALIEKYKIENNFDKMKPKDAQIVLQLTNDMTIDKLIPVKDSTTVLPPSVPEGGFFKKLFTKKSKQ